MKGDIMVGENYKQILSEVNKIAKNCNRKDDVRLISVSKTKPISMIKEVYDSGARDFGENKVQEIIAKYEKLPKDIRWHMIGHLQTNKVKYIADKVYMIHSVDSVKLANVISKEAVKVKRVIPVLIEVNVACEESKYGVLVSECETLIRDISHLPGIKVMGLMTVAPYTANAEENREYFKHLKQLSVDIMRKNIDNISMNFLSMGMSIDYRIAIEEGASYVRVGTGIFGEREYFSS